MSLLQQELTGTTPKANLITGGIDEFFQRKEAAATRYPMTDALGSVIALTDVAGVMATEYSYEAYGKATRSGAADANSQSFTGREDDDWGLMYYRARYYSPNLGRFISEDPLGWRAGQLNVYSYVANDPLNLIDPLGLEAIGRDNRARGPRPDRERPGDVVRPHRPQFGSDADRSICYSTCMAGAMRGATRNATASCVVMGAAGAATAAPSVVGAAAAAAVGCASELLVRIHLNAGVTIHVAHDVE